MKISKHQSQGISLKPKVTSRWETVMAGGDGIAKVRRQKQEILTRIIILQSYSKVYYICWWGEELRMI